MGGAVGGGGVFGLHEDEGHAGFGPISFEESGEGAVVAAEEWVGEEGTFEVVEDGTERRGPCRRGNGFTMEFFDEDSQGPDTEFEMWDETGVEVEKSNKRVEGCAVGGKRPIAD